VTNDTAVSEIDLFSPELVAEPYDALSELRDRAPAVYLSRYHCWILTRYADVRAAARDWRTFSSAHGVALLEPFNAMTPRSVLVTDPPEHTVLRSVLSEQLGPRAMSKLSENIHARAERLVAETVSRRDFDGVTDLAKILPVDIVADLIGLPEDGRDKLLPGADAIFTTFGPMTPTLEERMPLIEDYTKYMTDVTSRRALRPGSWGAAILDAIDDGRLGADTAVPQMSSYLVAGMDTTVNGISAMLHAFAAEPGLWTQLRAQPGLSGPVFEEALRTESPVQGFFRETTGEAAVDGSPVPASARVLLHFGAGNRDERHYPRPGVFDPRRNPVDHLAFGHGRHTCAGAPLARLEAAAVTAALLRHVKRFELTAEPRQHHNPVVRGLATLPLHVELN
jgi:cytochrome P450